MKTKTLFTTLNILFCSITVFAQLGANDNTFDPGTGANLWVQTTAIQNDGKIIIGGYFTSYNGTGRSHIARLNSDGTLDATFNPGTGAGSVVETIAIQSDGKIIIGGRFTSYNGTGRSHIARLNSDGTLDATFNPGTGTDHHVYTTALQVDGKVIIGGDFSSYNGTGRNRIARLNSDGTLDATFNPGMGANIQFQYVTTTAIQSDGKIMIGGNFTSYNGIGRNRIARLNSDGTLDATFNPGTGTDYIVNTTALQTDGKIIIGGKFTSYNGTGRNRIARLNSDGTLDATFNPGTGTDSIVNTTTLQSDAKIIIGGQFTSYNGTGRNRIARLNSDGTLDATFNPGTGANGPVWTTAIQSDGKIIIGGYFTFYNGTGRNYIARIFATSTSVQKNKEYGDNFIIYPNPFFAETILQTDIFFLNGTLTVYNCLGEEVRQIKNLSGKVFSFKRDNLPCGVYFVQLTQAEREIMTKKILIAVDTN